MSRFAVAHFHSDIGDRQFEILGVDEFANEIDASRARSAYPAPQAVSIMKYVAASSYAYAGCSQRGGMVIPSPGQMQRVADVYVTPSGVGKVTDGINRVIQEANPPSKVRVDLRGMVNGMQECFRSFQKGFILSFILLFLILVAQFRSLVDPFPIMPAVTLLAIHTSLNVMSLTGVSMLVGIADSNSMARAIIGGLTSSVILIVFIVPAAYVLVYGRKERHVS